MRAKILGIFAVLALFTGCKEEEEKVLEKPPVSSEVPSDVSIANPDPLPQINPQLPPEPVVE
ncbi:hypothetical protein OFO01_01585 [Campylobacter sp. JMF_01 NE2]|uniref:hypothetical protein n=1 Tax=unclassified Campylobacter TaxID=2593542 RepID=UPI0022E9BD44|nr:MULTISPECIES: hypothetical protein [unclassified Campylobacter]MDA3043101.1 hypothetical protein [Campylobacter sp. JMF_09 ED2]MDA3044861.1 hypothetical protein [Campylobacter sp. JMF_07 ED4]MDA3045874.1 hypothetical protein [Campylobacter sp. VBCF_06 NA8]MDA3049732.1 hypothetical protein [Campylobacter sp. JMF_15 NE4]MDA3050690.1 hypothetical protein [Campylobacter sp. JMF_02 ED1]